MWARWCPDSKRILFSGDRPIKGVRIYVQDMSGGQAKAITNEGVNGRLSAISPDGKQVAFVGPDQKPALRAVDSGEIRTILALDARATTIAGTRERRCQ